jgi:hypothetical protein
MSDMPVSCAWCGRVLSPDGTWATGSLKVDGPLVSHGMCPRCEDEQNGEPTEAGLSRYAGYNR